MNEEIKKNIDNIVWYIPFKKLRNSIRTYLQYVCNNISDDKNKEKLYNEKLYLEKKLSELEKNKEDVNKYLHDSGYDKIVAIGHYESPYPPMEEIINGLKAIDDNTSFMYDMYGVNMNNEVQLEFYDKISKFFDNFDFPEEKNDKCRYYYKNNWFGRSTAVCLFSIINYFKPKNIIEIGSGFSTSLMLDINNRIFNNSINILSIEPRADRLKSLLFKTDNISIIEKNQQDVPLEVFSKLEENDILFIDSSHVSRPFGDINRQFFNILPNLKKGVIIHLHDIYYPFEYPKTWLDGENQKRRAYTEAYMLRAFLQYNDTFEILLFPTYLNKKYNNYKNIKTINTSSIYLRKIR